LNVPFAWTGDSRSVIFISYRSGRAGIYKQALDEATPQVITAPRDFEAMGDTRLSPDGSWVVFTAWLHNSPSGTPARIYRVSVNGGPPQLLFGELPTTTDMFCMSRAANFCAYGSRAADGRSLLITAFDPVAGTRKELLRTPTEPGAAYIWQPSPDGSQVAILKREWHLGQIRFIPVGGGQTRTLTVKGYTNLQSLDWAPDAKSVFVGTSGPAGATLLHIDLNGNAQPIWRQPQPNQTWGASSPDGRHLAMLGQSAEANVWMIDNF
jgi:Tol biopolymer transport system component